MFAKYASRIKALPARGADWSSRPGPAALLGVDGAIAKSSRALVSPLLSLSRDSDTYCELQFQKTGPVEAPPETVVFLPILNCGEMVTDDTAAVPDAKEWHAGVLESATDLMEKGYVPVTVGGDGAATLALVEAYKRVNTAEEVVVVRFSAYADLADLDGPLRTIADKKLTKGVVSFGNRCVDFSSRRVRKAHKLMYVDQVGLFSKGYSQVRDLRNEYPIILSFDFNVIDPAFIPGVARPESGGFSVREALHFLHAMRGPKLVGIDFHGYTPGLDVVRPDGVGLSTFATSKLIKEGLAKVYAMSTLTIDEVSEKVQRMQAKGEMPNSPYPDF